ncbi:uncharacterized protein LOC129583357 [Paramacrobiotus metropolitanus]|uniref:uncharacterized protein LOC129583357 n=1 Tax=Paramacrobiotus metropolitanus TaxID=2943436 RepID=UPI0024462DC6|nr:uncharacterized protein LOC129583357 [Paramacrobiotus metropolitanus]
MLPFDRCAQWWPTHKMLVLVVLMMLLVSPGYVEMSKDGCSGFCRRTGFSGVIGNCACGLALFSSKRSVLPPKPSLENPSSDTGSLSDPGMNGKLFRNGIPKYLDSAARLLSATYYENSPVDNTGLPDEYTDI